MYFHEYHVRIEVQVSNLKIRDKGIISNFKDHFVPIDPYTSHFDPLHQDDIL